MICPGVHWPVQPQILRTKVSMQQLAARGMVDLRMELHAVEVAARHSGWRRPGHWRCRPPPRNRPAPPRHDRRGSSRPGSAPRQRNRRTAAPGSPWRQQVGMAELALAGRHHLAAEMAAHQLHAVADPQHRHAEFEQLLGNRRGARLVDRLRTAGENDPVGIERRGSPPDSCRRGAVRNRRGPHAPAGQSAGCTASRNRGSGSFRCGYPCTVLRGR